MPRNPETGKFEKADSPSDAAQTAPAAEPAQSPIAPPANADGIAAVIDQMEFPGMEGSSEPPIGWDPAVHEDPPRRNAQGAWARKRGGPRKRGQTVAPILSDAETGGQVQRDAAARHCVSLLIAVGMNLFGNEWTPVKEGTVDERAALETAFADYFSASGLIDVPPSIALCMAVGAYALPRLALPGTRERIGSIVGRFRRRRTPQEADFPRPAA